MAGKKKVYAVKAGRKTGLFTTWDETKAQVDGFPGAKYKGFTTREEAMAYLKEAAAQPLSKQPAAARSADRHAAGDVIIGYSDGGSRNTGNVKNGHVRQGDKAAWAYRLELAGRVVADTGGEWGATNNRMEIMALIKALQKLKALGQTKAEIAMVLDSKYVLDAVTKGWLKSWKRRGWQRSVGELKNAELWRTLDQLLPQFPNLTFSWTKGHADNAGNVFVDELLNQTMDHMGTGGAQSAPTAKPTPSTKISATKPTPPKKAPTTKPTQAEPMTPDVQKSVGDIEKALSQLDLFKDID